MKSKTRTQLARLMSELAKTKERERPRKSIGLKSKVVEEIKSLLSKYKVIAILSADRMPSAESRRIYSRLSEYGVVKLYKNSLVLRALQDMKAKNLEEISKYLTGSNIFVFTNINPFKLAKLLDELVEYRYAKPGDTVSFDIELAPGPTGIKPGPSMSLFGKLKIPTQVREGVIWIARDTKVLKQGDKVSPELSSLLRRLGVPVIPVKTQLKAVYEDGFIYLPKDLKIDFEEIKKSITAAVNMSKSLAVELALPVPEVIPELIARARRISIELASAIGYITSDVVQELLTKAVSQALLITQVISSKTSTELSTSTAQPESSEKRREEEERKEEEEIAEGIASLFG
ncbi:MAG: 50S ribosomal protein L10 [Sulfolobales archaeon]